MSDPVAEKSGFLRMYMSSHPDTLVAYAKWYGKVTEPIASAEMTAIDCRSMTLTCTMRNGSKKVVPVAIEPPMTGYDDVKPRLLEMKAKAQEGLGMIKTPQIDTFELNWGATAKVAFLYGVLSYCSFFPRDSSEMIWLPAKLVHSAIRGDYPLKVVWVTLTVAQTGYVAATFFGGFTVWAELRRRIQRLRIDSVMKVE
ncbi:hypothetical protein ONZ45_g673 [Pleurotus djamor]|nr:hypothetical protein ONZ45_g673 [Pleurotus djamor]